MPCRPLSLLFAVFALGTTAACGSGSDSALPGDEAAPPAAHGDVFQGGFGGLQLETEWSWVLGTQTAEPELGNCGYDVDTAVAPTGQWQARFSTDAQGRDPITDAAYPNGYWTVTAQGSLLQALVREQSSDAYHCAIQRDDIANALGHESVSVSVHLEMILGTLADGVHVKGYVTRLFLTGIAAPIDVSTGRPVLIAFSIPAPLLVAGTVQPDGEPAGSISLTLVGSSAPTPSPPAFELGIYTAIEGMSATTSLQFQSLHLRHAP